MCKQTNSSILPLKRLQNYASFLLLLLVLVSSCKKTPTTDPDPDPEPEPTSKGKISVTLPTEHASSQFAYTMFPLEGESSALNKTVVGALTAEEVSVGDYSLHALKFSDKEAQIMQPTAKTAALVVNKEVGTERILSLTENVFWASQQSVQIKEAELTTVALSPLGVLKYIDVAVTTKPEFGGLVARGVVSGVSDSFVVSTGKVAVESSKEIVFQMLETSPNVYSAKVGIFGFANKPTDGYKLSLELTKDGQVLKCSSDVTSQIEIATGNTIPIRATMSPESPVTPKTPIKLYASLSVPTRASNPILDSKNVGIASGAAPGAYTSVWAGKVSGSEVVLNPTRYYPEDKSSVYLCGFHPFANIDPNGNVNYNLTGSEDLMWASEQSGSLDQQFNESSSSLKYNRLLSQINFTIEIADRRHQYSLREINLDGIASSAILSLGNGAVAFGPATVSKQLYAAGTGSGLPITNGQLTIDNNLLVQPNATLKASVVLSIDDDRSHDITVTNVPVVIQGGAEGGKAYQVKLEFEDPSTPGLEGVAIKVSAQLTKWLEGAAGDAEIKPE